MNDMIGQMISRSGNSIAALLFAFFCLTACSGNAAAVIGPASAQSAIAGAHDGDTIRLEQGFYPSLTIKDQRFSRGVTITSADPARPAQVQSVRIVNSSGIVLRDLAVTDTALRASAGLIEVRDSSNVTVSRIRMTGGHGGFGFKASGSRNLSLLDSEIGYVKNGIDVNTSRNVTISGNRIHDLQLDGLDIVEVTDVRITGNRFWNFAPRPGDHPDAIQAWTASAKAPTSNLEISGNLIIGTPGEMQPQGIFITDQKGSLPYIGINVHDNVLVGTAWNGIMLDNARDSSITGNRLFTAPGQKVTATRIRVNKMTGTVSHNIAKQYVLPKSAGPVMKGNKTKDAGEGAALKAIAEWDRLNAAAGRGDRGRPEGRGE